MRQDQLPGVPGRVVQVEPIKPMLKAPGTKRLKLLYEEPPSSFAFEFNLRRYSLANREVPIPDHIDLYHLREEAEPTDRSALQSVVDELTNELARLQKLEQYIMETAGAEDERLEVAPARSCSPRHRTPFIEGIQETRVHNACG